LRFFDRATDNREEMRVLLLALLTFGPAFQSALPIRGIVIDPAGSPLAGATISVDSPGSTPVTSAADGRFEVTISTPGPHRLTIVLAGFQPADAAVPVPEPGGGDGAGKDLRITLVPRTFGETVSVTATRGSERLEGAAPASVVTPVDLQLAASPALDDALRTVPGFSLFRRTSSRTANPTAQGASLRGLSASGASRALVLADGSPLNDPFGGWVYWDRVPQAAIERVEVVRGGTSDLYGADALSGVVQVLTVRPRGPSVSATIEAASHRTPRASIFSGTAGNGWTASAAGEASRTNGTYVIAPEDRGAVDVRAGNDYLSGLATFSVARPSGWSLRVRGDGLGENRENGTPLQTNSTDVRQGRFDLSGPLASGWLDSYGQIGDQVYRQAFSSIGPSRATETLTVRQRVPASQFGYGLTWRRLLGESDLLVGAETREIVAINEETAYFPGGSVRSSTSTRGFQRSSGVFAQVRAALGTKSTLVAGARADIWQRSRSLDGTGVVSPRVSVSHRLSDRVTIRAAFTSSFRPPTLNERYRGFRVGNAVTLANTDLDAEELASGEIGTLVDLPRGTVRATFFASSLDSAITNVTLSATPQLITRQRENAGTVRARGIETEGEYRVRPGVSVLGAVAFTHARFVDTPALSGNRVPQVPVWQGTAGARWIAPGALTVQAQLRAFGDQFEDDRNTLVLRQAALVDVSLTHSISRRVAAFASAENLFDTEYDTGRTPTRTIGTPRTIRVGARLFLP
jgi:outer membrane receptor protein involved in Fe transport